MRKLLLCVREGIFTSALERLERPLIARRPKIFRRGMLSKFVAATLTQIHCPQVNRVAACKRIPTVSRSMLSINIRAQRARFSGDSSAGGLRTIFGEAGHIRRPVRSRAGGRDKETPRGLK